MTPRVVTIGHPVAKPWEVCSYGHVFSIFLKGPFSHIVDGQEVPVVLLGEEARALGLALIAAADHCRQPEPEPEVTP